MGSAWTEPSPASPDHTIPGWWASSTKSCKNNQVMTKVNTFFAFRSVQTTLTRLALYGRWFGSKVAAQLQGINCPLTAGSHGPLHCNCFTETQYISPLSTEEGWLGRRQGFTSPKLIWVNHTHLSATLPPLLCWYNSDELAADAVEGQQSNDDCSVWQNLSFSLPGFQSISFVG